MRKSSYEIRIVKNGIDYGKLMGSGWYGKTEAQKIAKALNRSEQKHFGKRIDRYKAVKY